MVLAQVEDQKLNLLPDILHKGKAWVRIRQTGGGKEKGKQFSLEEWKIQKKMPSHKASPVLKNDLQK